MGKGNGEEMVGRTYHCFMEGLFDVLQLLYMEGYSIYIGTASTLYCRPER